MTRRDGKRPEPAVIVGGNIVARTTGQHYEARPMAKLPAKQAGRHRWIVSAAWVVSEATLAKLGPGPGREQYMDHENLLHITIGCWDCEQALGDPSNGGVEVGSRCPGDPNGVEW